MLVSIIVPVYGVESYLDKCIESIVSQSYRDIEIILIDDGSPDNCPMICDKWAEMDSRICVIHKKNEGQGIARNIGLKIARGEYILFVDSDDYIDANMVNQLISSSENGKYAIVLCGFIAYTGLYFVNRPWFDHELVLANEGLMTEYVRSRLISAGPVCKLIRKNVMENIQFPSFRANEDAFIMHHLLGKCENARIIPDRLYYQNIRPDSTENKPFSANNMHLLDCAYNLREYVERNYPDLFRYVSGKPAEDAINLLKKLFLSANIKAHAQEKAILQEILLKEYEFLKDKDYDPKLHRALHLHYHNSTLFMGMLHFEAALRILKGKLKKVLVSLKKGVIVRSKAFF